MQSRQVVIVRTGVANIASVMAALGRLGAGAKLSEDPAELRDCEALVLPGVGAFAPAMEQLHARGIAGALADRVQQGRPTLAICLGLQLLCASSDESPGVAGLGVIDAGVERFPDEVRVPQLGWNQVYPDPGCRLITPGHAYFANSYRLAATPPGWLAGVCDYGGRFVAALERGRILACQFHPELSGDWGLALIDRWLTVPEKEEG
jgi:imidazole glycerol-phosphate synthase subunit HisH